MVSESSLPEGIRALRAPLLRWYGRAKRDLPWRRTRDPYAIWVSEAMLQQTTVAAVVPYWARFLERFPDLPALAGSREEEVLAAWSGLGYYRRARSLREAAIAVMERHGGAVPTEPEALRALPGVGRYTAGAIASLAFGKEAPVVDGNVRRVLARLLARRDLRESETWRVAEALVRGPRPGEFNQAVMELGATVCTPRSPRCAACPVRGACRALATGDPEAFPAPRTLPASRPVAVAAAWIERRGRVLLEKKRDDGLLRGAWDVPCVATRRGEDPGAAIATEMRRRHRLTVGAATALAAVRHTIQRTRLDIAVVGAEISGPAPRSRRLRWVDPRDLARVPHSGATRKIAQAAAAAQKRSHAERLASAGASSGASGRSKA